MVGVEGAPRVTIAVQIGFLLYHRSYVSRKEVHLKAGC